MWWGSGGGEGGGGGERGGEGPTNAPGAAQSGQRAGLSIRVSGEQLAHYGLQRPLPKTNSYTLWLWCAMDHSDRLKVANGLRSCSLHHASCTAG